MRFGYWVFDRLAFRGEACVFVLEFGLAWRAKDGSLTVKLGFFSGVKVVLFLATFGFYLDLY